VTAVIEPFLAAADVAAAVLAASEVAAVWDEPSALAGYTVGGLAAHLLLATERTETVLDEEEPVGARVVGVAEFYGVNRVDDPADADQGLHPIVRDAAAKMAEQGPAGLAERFSSLVDRLRLRLPTVPPDRLVTILQVPDGATPLDTYLRTRIVELVVHVDDLACSAPALAAVELPVDAVDIAVDVFVELARSRSGDLAVVRAFTRAERAAPEVLRVL